MSDEYAGVAIMMNLGHWVFSKYVGSIDFSLERDAIIRQLRDGLHELIDALKGELPGAGVWICAEACVRYDQCRMCHRADQPMFRAYYEGRYLDGEAVQRIREAILQQVKKTLPLSEAEKGVVTADIGRLQMTKMESHGGVVQLQ